MIYCFHHKKLYLNDIDKLLIAILLLLLYITEKLELNKIAARWPAKAVAQFSIPKLKSSGNQVLIVVLLSHHNQQSNRIDITTAYEKINTQPFF